MIDELLPGPVVAVEAYGVEEAGRAALYPEEQAVMLRAVAKRRREFAAVRECARRAMEKLGVPRQPVLPGAGGAPGWPAGLVGSMTHCDGYYAAALGRAADVASLGIDAEPHEPLPQEVLPAVTLPDERHLLDRLAEQRPDVHWPKLLFSAKESVYKAWFPLTGEWLDFTEADVDIRTSPGAPHTGTFRARLLVPGPLVGERRLTHFDGRWTVRAGLLATAVTVPAH
ncbi:4'-phosphopantetheinyl transferase [Streptomyces sp. NPDC056160]|uniref:4'-phosphopantetheinyl transferase family protein n=1 Tax=Streptomyces sp. NPDC056160 TaxID=3345731 RepID=UPI0035E2592E